MARSILALFLVALTALPLATAALPSDAGADQCRALVGAGAAVSCGPALIETWRAVDAGPIAGGQSNGGRSVLVSADGASLVVLSTARTPGGQSLGDFLTGYDALTGAVAWSHMLNADATLGCAAGSVQAGPDPALAYVSGTCAGAADAKAFLAAFDIKSGAPVWWNGDEGLASIVQVPILQNGLFYAPGPETLKPVTPLGIVIVDAASGALVRHLNLSALGTNFRVWCALAVSPDGSTLYLTAHDINGAYGNTTTFAVDAVTGAVRWSARFVQDGFTTSYQSSTAVSADGARLLVLEQSSDKDGHAGTAAVAYDTSDGGVAWMRAQTGRLFRWALAGASSFYVEDYQYAHPSVGNMLRLDAATGDIIFDASTPGCWCGTTSPWALSPDGAQLYVGQMDESTGAYSVCRVDAIAGGTPSCRTAFRPLPDGSGAFESMGIAIAPDGGKLYFTGLALARDATSATLLAHDAQQGGDPTKMSSVTATVAYELGGPWPLNAAPSAP